ncbi:50S ribosomal protein L29 [Syntrophus aciditrophicus]|uniref:Large ribosomal subunit protein uL29 n=1 Tax=Syntrophus aciditrophicus (strain SB) TaxID=56780 RepID=RL29_SYNAS|nr:50S ribosomal protein L29 [Syntrophus aciditrophicus]Q2LQB2.1 RecName: Full=Large ribosomal subunit protein uL29; AltName: Full=50S ribosomal protein L29 [Syntrophus aciditrophicus SB]ABC76189.1 LSU ribosomal protein L29P [Syntrophus aciditrophicus SB]OPY17614.1 MAG: 50S ribosomal protein L29 [Syntrophus sp. PtaB.Bin075]
MKAKEWREKSLDEIRQKNKELEEELFNLRMRSAAGQLESSAALGKIKRDIARAKTVLREKGVKEH